jgi:hypothetical protein
MSLNWCKICSRYWLPATIGMWAGRNLFDSRNSGAKRFCAFVILLLTIFFTIIILPALVVDEETSEPARIGGQPTEVPPMTNE